MGRTTASWSTRLLVSQPAISSQVVVVYETISCITWGVAGIVVIVIMMAVGMVARKNGRFVDREWD